MIRAHPLSRIVCALVLGVCFILTIACFPAQAENVSEQAEIPLQKTGMANAKGYDFVLDSEKITLSAAEVTSSTGDWEIVPGDPMYLQRKTATPAGNYSFSDTITLRFPDCIVAYDGGSYDFILTLSDLSGKLRGDTPHLKVMNDYSWYPVEFLANNGGISMTATYQVVKHGTNEPVSGTLLMGFLDLDTPNYNDSYGSTYENYQESVRLLSGISGPVWVEPDTLLYIYDNNRSFTSSGWTNGLAEEKRSGLSVLGDASGATILWTGTDCGTGITFDMNAVFPSYEIIPSSEGPGTITPDAAQTVSKGMSREFQIQAEEHGVIKEVLIDGESISVTDPKNMTYTFSDVQTDHTIHVVFEKDTHTQTTRVRWQNVDGSWTNYETADEQVISCGNPYSYTWVRNTLREEPEAVYFDGSPNSVGTDSVTEDGSYAIDVARKQYTYSFDFNPPSGHTVSEIGNRQENLTDRYAETVPGTIKVPTLAGYIFLGWNTEKDGSGEIYQSSPMLSDQTFYAQWDVNSYQVRYDGNGLFNPDHLEGELTQNNVTSVSGMPASTFAYDQTGTLRRNDFTRDGYTFTGWNTKKDGSGTFYPDGYDQILNLTNVNDGMVTLYAQWEKGLGSTTVTVVSEETGNPMSGLTMTLYHKVNGTWVEDRSCTTDASGCVSLDGLHWFDYQWRFGASPSGYQTMKDASFQICPGNLSHGQECICYLKHCELVLHSSVSDIIDGERPPAFLYEVKGTDAAGVIHTYHVMVATDASKQGTYRLDDLFAGTYTVTQIPVQRYLPETPKGIDHVTVSGQKATAQLLDAEHGEVLFPYTITQYGGFGHTDNERNELNP